MQANESTQDQDFVTSLALQRQRLLHHAASLMEKDAQPEAGAVTRLSQTLTTSLELLKIAEEELRDERRTSATILAAQEKRMMHLQSLFDLAPPALLLTGADTTIREANHAAARFLGREPSWLTGERLSEMVPRAQQAGFREQLASVVEHGDAAAWRFTIEVRRATPAAVVCAVRLITDSSIGTRALYWFVTPAAA